MYSVYGDTVLDPFLGTGTTTVAAMAAGRNSVGYEVDGDLAGLVDRRIEEVPALADEVAADRLDAHRRFVADRREAGDDLDYEAEHYGFPVRTRQERRIRLYGVDAVERTGEGYVVTHSPVEG